MVDAKDEIENGLGTGFVKYTTDQHLCPEGGGPAGFAIGGDQSWTVGGGIAPQEDLYGLVNPLRCLVSRSSGAGIITNTGVEAIGQENSSRVWTGDIVRVFEGVYVIHQDSGGTGGIARHQVLARNKG
jgi:hypothetical protein